MATSLAMQTFIVIVGFLRSLYLRMTSSTKCATSMSVVRPDVRFDGFWVFDHGVCPTTTQGRLGQT